MKKLLLTMLIALMTGSATATVARTPQLDARIAARAKSVAIANGVKLAEYKEPSVSRTNDRSWLVLFQHVQRYRDKKPVFMFDDCFSVWIDGSTNEASFHPCP